jgi:hypothetical protein
MGVLSGPSSLGCVKHSTDEAHTVAVLGEYLARAGARISRAEFEANLLAKLELADFRADVVPLLRDPAGYDVGAAADIVLGRLVARLAGEPWKGTR